jgi:hypothetical protein
LVDDPADYSLREDGVTVNNGLFLWAGSQTDGQYNAIYIFPMPVLRPNEYITQANLRSATGAKVGPIDFNVDLYAIGFQNTTDPLPAFLEGNDPDLGATKLQDNILTPASPANSPFETSDAGDAALASYMNGFYAEAAGYTGGSYLFVRLNPDGVPGATPAYFELMSSEGQAAFGDSLPDPSGLGPGAATLAMWGLARRRRTCRG